MHENAFFSCCLFGNTTLGLQLLLLTCLLCSLASEASRSLTRLLCPQLQRLAAALSVSTKWNKHPAAEPEQSEGKHRRARCASATSLPAASQSPGSLCPHPTQYLSLLPAGRAAGVELPPGCCAPPPPRPPLLRPRFRSPGCEDTRHLEAAGTATAPPAGNAALQGCSPEGWPAHGG